ILSIAEPVGLRSTFLFQIRAKIQPTQEIHSFDSLRTVRALSGSRLLGTVLLSLIVSTRNSLISHWRAVWGENREHGRFSKTDTECSGWEPIMACINSTGIANTSPATVTISPIQIVYLPTGYWHSSRTGKA